MEFVGVEKGLASKGNQTINPTTELESEHCSPTSQRCLTKDKPMHYPSLVKPQMIQQVLPCRGVCEERKADSIPSHSDMRGSREGKLMELFPQHPGFDTTKPLNTGSCLTLASHHHLTEKSTKQLQGRSLLTPFGVGGVQPAGWRSVSPATTPQKQSAAQLTIFYDGTVNVFDLPADRAQAIMNMIGGNRNARQSDADPNFDEGGSSNRPLIWKATPTSAHDEVPTELPTPEISATAQKIKEIENLHGEELPLARRQSLQRFIEKRQNRLNSVTPYTTSATLVKKAVDDRMGHPLNFPSQS